jgi:hypothetical protein
MLRGQCTRLVLLLDLKFNRPTRNDALDVVSNKLVEAVQLLTNQPFLIEVGSNNVPRVFLFQLLVRALGVSATAKITLPSFMPSAYGSSVSIGLSVIYMARDLVYYNREQ